MKVFTKNVAEYGNFIATPHIDSESNKLKLKNKEQLIELEMTSIADIDGFIGALEILRRNANWKKWS